MAATDPGYLPSSWAGCLEGGTPGRANSVAGGGQGGPFFSVWPSPFSPDGDGVDDLLHIQMNASNAENEVTVRIYNVQGRVVRTLADGIRCGSTLSLQWDGSDRSGASMPVGRYIAYLCCRPDPGEPREALKVVVLARRL